MREELSGVGRLSRCGGRLRQRPDQRGADGQQRQLRLLLRRLSLANSWSISSGRLTSWHYKTGPQDPFDDDSPVADALLPTVEDILGDIRQNGIQPREISVQINRRQSSRCTTNKKIALVHRCTKRCNVNFAVRGRERHQRLVDDDQHIQSCHVAAVIYVLGLRGVAPRMQGPLADRYRRTLELDQAPVDSSRPHLRKVRVLCIKQQVNLERELVDQVVRTARRLAKRAPTPVSPRPGTPGRGVGGEGPDGRWRGFRLATVERRSLLRGPGADERTFLFTQDICGLASVLAKG